MNRRGFFGLLLGAAVAPKLLLGRGREESVVPELPGLDALLVSDPVFIPSLWTVEDNWVGGSPKCHPIAIDEAVWDSSNYAAITPPGGKIITTLVC